MVHRDGNDVVIFNELRHIKNIPLMMRYPLTESSLPAVKAVLGWKGVVDGTDYRKKSCSCGNTRRYRIPGGFLSLKSIQKKYTHP
ncbi:MAG: hypothetical protein MZV70_22725 [Desulfobacterales bacterium]|nr:hypothetical protein [Desulfobacterales bacterium]